MEEVKQAIQCNICDEINEEGTHYCKKCGRNLSDKIEVTDILFGISKILEWITICIIVLIIIYLIVWLLYILPITITLLINGVKINITNGIVIILLSQSVICLLSNWLVKKIALNLCKKNIKKE